jgi:hypothetical protein
MTNQKNEPNTERSKMRAMGDIAHMRGSIIWLAAVLIVLIFVGYIGVKLTHHQTTYSEPDLPHTAR